MSQIAERTGIGRATVYKYFPDVDSILPAWHERQISGDLAHLLQVRDQVGDDVPPDHLATFCLHAVAAACEVPSGDAAASCSR